MDVNVKVNTRKMFDVVIANTLEQLMTELNSRSATYKNFRVIYVEKREKPTEVSLPPSYTPKVVIAEEYLALIEYDIEWEVQDDWSHQQG